MSEPGQSSLLGKWSRFRSPLVSVPIVGMAYVELVYVTFTLFFIVTTGGVPFFVFFWLPFMILMPVSILVVWRRPRIGYVMTTVLAVLALGFFGDGGHGVEIFASPASTPQFFEVITDLPAYVAILLYSVLGFLDTWHMSVGETPKQIRVIPRYSIAGLLIVGFIIGGLVIGLIAGATESRLLQNGSGDIVIPAGAGSQNNKQFYNPSVFQAKVGHAVTWANRDSTAHTVTTDGSALDSCNIDVVASYSFTFSQTGNYTYHCTYHLWMTSKVTVVT